MIWKLNIGFGLSLTKFGLQIGVHFKTCCTRCCSHTLWRKILREAILKFFVKNVVRENGVQMFSNFPAKCLLSKFFGGKIGTVQHLR